MKQRLIRVLLLAVAAAVWGAVLWKALHKSAATPVAAPPVVQAALKAEQVDEPPKLVLSRDPFLDGTDQQTERMRRVKENASSAHAPKPVASPTVAVKPKAWPTITYKGMVRDPHRGEAVALLTIDNRHRMLTDGDAIDGIRLVQAEQDSVLLEFMGATRYMSRVE